MATMNRIASTVTNAEIRSRIAELEESTEDDDMFDEWSNVPMLEAELERRGEPRGTFWEEIEPEDTEGIDPDAERVLSAQAELRAVWRGEGDSWSSNLRDYLED